MITKQEDFIRKLIREELDNLKFNSSVVDVEWYDDKGYFNGVITGEMYCVEKELCVIQFIESHSEGSGFVKKFLKELKEYFEKVVATGVDDNSIDFWEHMYNIGLVDEITDDGGNQIF
jgi:hypothetical protein